MASSSSKQSQKRNVDSKSVEKEEIVRYMSNLPSYLERGKPIQDRALNFGVMDWGRLEQWQYHHHKQGVIKTDRYSPSGSSSTDRSSLHSSKDKSSHVTLQFHLNVSHEEISTKPCSRNIEKSRDFKDAPVNQSSEKKTTNRSRPKSKDCKKLHESKLSDDTGSFRTAPSSSSSSYSKGKMKIQDELVNEIGNFHDSSYGTCDGALFGKSEDVQSDSKNDIPKSFSFENEIVNRKNLQVDAYSERNPSTPCQIKTPEGKEISVSSKKLVFSFSMGSKSAASKSSTKAVESPPVSQNSTKDNTSVSHRTHSSPLRRLLDPLFASTEDSKTKAKVKMDLRSCKEVKVDDSCRNKSSTKQALFQMAVKNGRPLFTFAVDNNEDILAATVRSISGKDDTNSWIYTFFTVQEVKKKKGGWLSQGTKSTNHGYLPNVTAQMTVSNHSVSDCREFVLSSVDSGQTEPLDELAAIVVLFLRKEGEEENRDGFSTTVILPGGHHSVPRKGEPSPLIERWRSDGVCDCGGWDVGCRLRTFTNKVQSDGRSNSPEAHVTSGKFDLFFQGDVINERPFFCLSPLKEGIFSVEYNSSLSLLHAFSICISVIECRKSSHHTELKTYVAKQVDDNETPVITYASLPPVSHVGRV